MSGEEANTSRARWSVDRRELWTGVGLEVLTFLMPLVFNVRSFHVLYRMDAALLTGDKTNLMAASAYYALLISLRSVPHYVGIFFISESLSLRRLKKYQGLLHAALVFLLLTVTYEIITLIYGTGYDFLISAVCVSLFAMVFSSQRYDLSLSKKAMMIALVLAPLQLLNIVPALERLPIGRGETAQNIRNAARLIGAEGALNALGLLGVVQFLIFAGIVMWLLREESTLRQLNQLREQNAKMRERERINEVRARSYEEIQYLVHDLKTPMTAAQTMVDVIRMKHEGEEDFADRAYLERIESAVELMSNLVSEIRYEDRRLPAATQKLADKTLSQASAAGYAPYLHAENAVPEAYVLVNRFYFTRVLLNLLQNAAQSVPEGRTPEIWLRVGHREDPDGAKIIFSVSDNGVGIAPEDREKIWDKGVSGTGSSGFGLAFVRGVVEGMGGTIELTSTVGSGSTFSIVLRQEGEPE